MFKHKYWAIVLTAKAIAIGATAVFSQPSFAESVNITCQTNGTPTVVASKADGTKHLTILKFVENYFSNSVDALDNCKTTANTLQTLYNNDSLYTLASDTIDGQPVVCALQGVGSCNSEDARVLFTLKNDVNPNSALYNMLGSDFVSEQPESRRTVSRIYTDIRPKVWWQFF